MNVGSLYLYKILTMKTSLFLKKALFLLLLLLLLLFVDYVIMIAVGCATSLFGFGADFYCGTYCIIGKIVLAASAILFLFLIFPEIKDLFKTRTYATATKEKKSI